MQSRSCLRATSDNVCQIGELLGDRGRRVSDETRMGRKSSWERPWRWSFLSCHWFRKRKQMFVLRLREILVLSERRLGESYFVIINNWTWDDILLTKYYFLFIVVLPLKLVFVGWEGHYCSSPTLIVWWQRHKAPWECVSRSVSSLTNDEVR